MRVIVLYESKYGNTRLVAEKIVEGMRKAGGVDDITIKEVKALPVEEVKKYDVIIIGSPNHIGGPTWGIKRFIRRMGKLGLTDKWFAVFDTCLGGREYERAVKKMEKLIMKNTGQSRILLPGLSIKVKGIKGPIVEGELERCEEFGEKIIELFKGKNKE
ncbi:MAG: flavodoxin domain-containing protein [Candidatus Korarchaeum sp.]|nr:flavodoxin domain-containing protein [Candidatus Korarchaeum sp.]